ncbi:MAG: T9SS type A sorting domain-containing protein [Flavobacteriaceae bacterium]|nr:T9SS type A sorting domain-containing protein [Flavobacteriaceae bacterium]
MKKVWFIGLFFFLSHSHAQVEAYDLGTVVNNFTATDTEGNTFDLYEQCNAGKYVFIKFYLSTCSYCQYITPFFNELYEKYGCNSGDLTCISVNGFTNNAGVVSFEDSYSGGFSHPTSISTDGGSVNIINRFNPNSYPTVCIIAPDRTIVNLNIWPISGLEDLENAFPVGFNPNQQACALNQEDWQNSDEWFITNPIRNQVLHINSKNEEMLKIQIFNLQGSIVQEYETMTNLDSPINLNSGIYFLQIQSETKINLRQIIVQ